MVIQVLVIEQVFKLFLLVYKLRVLILLVSIGLASINDGHISGVTITNPQFFYKPRDIYNVGYSSITGITTITTAFAHNLSVGNEVVVSGIAFTCDYAPGVGVQSANYDNTTGIMTDNYTLLMDYLQLVRVVM